MTRFYVSVQVNSVHGPLYEVPGPTEASARCAARAHQGGAGTRVNLYERLDRHERYAGALVGNQPHWSEP